MFSWSAQAKVSPIAMTKAEGIYFWDALGNKWTDMNSQLMCSNIGHGNKKVIEAIKSQAEELCYAGPGFATKVRAEVGPILAKHTPGDLKSFFFTLGGAEANENAIKLARFYTGRPKIIARYRSYHGATHGAMMLTGDSRRWPNEMFSPMAGIIRVFDPYKYRSDMYKEGDTDLEFSQKKCFINSRKQLNLKIQMLLLLSFWKRSLARTVSSFLLMVIWQVSENYVISMEY